MSHSPHAFGITKGVSAASKFYLADGNGDIEFQDSDKIIFGTESDTSIYWDGDSLEIAPENVPVNIGHILSTVTVLGNLTVAGTTTTVDSVVMSVANQISFEGATPDDFETILTVVDPTADRTWTLPNVTDTVVGLVAAQTLTNKTLTSPVLNTGVSGSAVQDDDSFGSESATKLASSKSIKAYVDAQGGGVGLTGSTNNTIVTVTGSNAIAGEANLTFDGSDLSVGDGNITNVGDINCDSVSVDDASVGLNIAFGGTSALNKITLTDHLVDALNINEGGTSYLKFVTTNGAEKIVFGKGSTFAGTTIDDLGSVTTADINGGSVDGAIIGAASAAAGTFTSLDVSDGNITNVGNIALDSITADGSTISITGNTTFVDGAYDFDIASHDGTNGLKLGGTLIAATAGQMNNTLSTVTSATAISATSNRYVLVDTSSGAVTVTLNADVTNGTTVTIKKKTSDTTAVTITSTDNIDGGTGDLKLNYHNEAMTFISDGADWYVV